MTISCISENLISLSVIDYDKKNADVKENIVGHLNNLILDNKRNDVIEILKGYGFIIENFHIITPDNAGRQIQKRFAERVNNKYKKYELKSKPFFAEENDIDQKKIEPVLELINLGDNKRREIFNYAKSFWSAPVSSGYGRRLDYIVWDKNTSKVIGILGLADSLISLGVRDKNIFKLQLSGGRWIKSDISNTWGKEQRMNRLYNTMTAYILGAVPPYNKYLCSKLIALLSTSNTVRNDFKNRYQGKQTIIRKEVKIPELVMVDTMGAFGKSSIYNRLDGWKFIGKTNGQTHVHLSCNGVYDILYDVVRIHNEEILKTYKFGNGSNWKLRVIAKGLSILGLGGLLTNGIRRGYYVAPLINNLEEFLSGKTDKPNFIDRQEQNLIKYWKERWLVKKI